jgi:hypothetical protein
MAERLWDGFDGPEQPSTVPDVPGAGVRPLAGPGTQDAADEIKASLGIGVPRRRFQPGGLRPDVSGLAEGLGLK